MVSLTCEVVGSIDDVNENQWNNVVAQSPGATAFHRTGWLRAIEDGLDRQPRHVVVRKKSNPIAVCPNFVSAVETPFDLPVDLSTVGLAQLSSVTPGFGGPLVSGNRERSLDAILDAVEAVTGRDAIVHRMRVLDPEHVEHAHQLHARGYAPSLLYCRLWLELDDYDRIRDDMDKERRKEIREAEDDVEVVAEDVTREAMREFYAEYLKTIERTDGTRYPRPFFEALADHFADRVEIFTARVDGEDAGKHLYLRDEEQDSLHYFFAGVDAEYFQYSSPTVIHDHALRWGIDEGYATYDFGASGADHRDGVFEYKRKFGTQVEPVYEWERGLAPVRWQAYRQARRRYLGDES